MSAETSTERHELWQVLDKLVLDLNAATAKLQEARRMLVSLDLPDPKTVTCPRCGIKRTGPRSLAEHMYSSHDGAMPEHWENDSALLRDSDA
jgi:hypothetical protein